MTKLSRARGAKSSRLLRLEVRTAAEAMCTGSKWLGVFHKTLADEM